MSEAVDDPDGTAGWQRFVAEGQAEMEKEFLSGSVGLRDVPPFWKKLFELEARIEAIEYVEGIRTRISYLQPCQSGGGYGQKEHC
jgi:hypothetical protein